MIRLDDRVTAAAALVGRLLLAALFIVEGVSKMRDYGEAVEYMEAYSVPTLLLPLVILLEVGAGALLAIGWQARLSALALAVFCVLTALLFHFDFDNRGQVLHFEKNFAIAGGLLAFFAFGPGRWSLDARGG
jgi:putative oxidoreductase